MQSSLSKKLIKELAVKYKLPEYKVRDIINSYFHFTAFVINNEANPEKGIFPTVGIPFFGKFFHYKKRTNEDI